MTDWYTEPTIGRQWILGDDTLLDEPVLEVSGSRRRVRAFNRQSTSAAYSSRADVLLNEVRRLAKGRRTYPWIPLFNADSKMHLKGCDPDKGHTELFLIDDQTAQGKTKIPTTVFWVFQHPTLPIKAQVVITGETAYGANRHEITTSLSLPDTRPDRLISGYITEQSNEFGDVRKHLLHHSETELLDKVLKAVEKALPGYLVEADDLIGEHTFNSRRQAATHMLKAVRWADSLETIQVPDLRHGEPAWLDLELVETNMSAQLTTDLTEYLVAGPTIDKALDAYNEFQALLKSLGIALPPVNENQIQRLLLAGDDKAVTLNVMSTTFDLDGEADHRHGVSIHLTTGTVAVKCTVNPVDPDQIAESYAEAQAIASISGRETELLAYAREFARTNDEAKTRKLIARRRAGLIKS